MRQSKKIVESREGEATAAFAKAPYEQFDDYLELVVDSAPCRVPQTAMACSPRWCVVPPSIKTSLHAQEHSLLGESWALAVGDGSDLAFIDVGAGKLVRVWRCAPLLILRIARLRDPRPWFGFVPAV